MNMIEWEESHARGEPHTVAFKVTESSCDVVFCAAGFHQDVIEEWVKAGGDTIEQKGRVVCLWRRRS